MVSKQTGQGKGNDKECSGPTVCWTDQPYLQTCGISGVPQILFPQDRLPRRFPAESCRVDHMIGLPGSLRENLGKTALRNGDIDLQKGLVAGRIEGVFGGHDLAPEQPA